MSQPKRREAPRRTTLSLALPSAALILLGASGEALASGFSTARFGGEHGNPTTSNPTAIYYNPAGIALSDGIHLFLDGNLAIRSATYGHAQAESDLDEPADAVGANYGEATLLNAAAAPMLGATVKLGDFAAGIGFYVPFGGAAVWDQNPEFEGHRLPGPVDNVQRWFTIEGTLRSFYLTAAAAYHIEAARLSLGLSGNLILSEINTIRARNTDGSNFLPTEGRSLIDVSGTSFGFGVGAVFEAVPEVLWIGASYQSRPNVAGGMTLEGTLTNKIGPGDPIEDPIKVTQDLPDIVRLGVRYKVSDVIELRLFGDWTRWSSFQDQCLSAPEEECEVNEDGSGASLREDGTTTVVQNLPRRWHDAFGLRAGFSYWPDTSAEIFAGAGYDSNAIPDATLDPALMDLHDVSLAIGVRLQVAEPVHVAASYTHFFYVARDTTGNADQSEFQAPSIGPDAGGFYGQSVGVINANVEVAF